MYIIYGMYKPGKQVHINGMWNLDIRESINWQVQWFQVALDFLYETIQHLSFLEVERRGHKLNLTSISSTNEEWEEVPNGITLMCTIGTEIWVE
jgi:hypothetical protein